MASVLRRFSATSCGALFAICCSQVWAESSLATTLFSSNIPYDEFTASVPRQQAETPSVALAKIYIALYHAKQFTEAKLCNGKWTPNGILLYRQGPGTSKSLPGHTNDNKQSWHYQSLRQPVTLVCPNVARAEYFLEMSRHLPAWISIRPAGYETTFQLGQAFTGGQHSLATR